MCSNSGTVLGTYVLCIIPYCSVNTVDVLKVPVISACHFRIPFSWHSLQTLFASPACLFWDFHICSIRFLSALADNENVPERSFNFLKKMLTLLFCDFIKHSKASSVVRIMSSPRNNLEVVYKHVKMHSLFIMFGLQCTLNMQRFDNLVFFVMSTIAASQVNKT